MLQLAFAFKHREQKRSSFKKNIKQTVSIGDTMEVSVWMTYMEVLVGSLPYRYIMYTADSAEMQTAGYA